MKNIKSKCIMSLIVVFTGVFILLCCEGSLRAASKKQKLVMNKSFVTLLKGDTFKLKPKKIKRADSYKTIKYKSDKNMVATVSSKGVIKAVNTGNAKITVSSIKNKNVKCVVKVRVKKNNQRNKKQGNNANKLQVSQVPATSTPVTALPTINPKDVITFKGYVHKKTSDTLVLTNGENTTTVLCIITNRLPADCKITYQGASISVNDIEEGDYISAKHNGVMQAMYPPSTSNCMSIEVISKNPDMKNKIYSYEIKSISEDSNCITTTDNYNLYLKRSSDGYSRETLIISSIFV